MLQNMKMVKSTAVLAAILMLTACSGTKSESVVELTKNDKHMDCTTLQLEMTEAEFFRDRAVRNKSLSVRNVILPLGYASTYMSAENAIEAASGRADYLARLYEVKGCANQAVAQNINYGGGYQQQPMMAGGAQAPIAYNAPVYQQPYMQQQQAMSPQGQSGYAY